MKNLIALLMVLGLIGFAVAQDLDAPTSGVSVEADEEAPAQAAGIYDLLVAKVLAAEAEYMGGAREQVWSQYLGVSQVVAGWGTWNGGWMTDREAWDQWAMLTPAEQAEFQGFMRDSWDRVIAAGLN